MISAKFVPLKYYTLSSQLRRLTSFSVGLFGSANSVTRSYPVMRKSCIAQLNNSTSYRRKPMCLVCMWGECGFVVVVVVVIVVVVLFCLFVCLF